MSLLLTSLFLLGTALGIDLPPTLTFHVTYRDFLQSDCLFVTKNETLELEIMGSAWGVTKVKDLDNTNENGNNFCNVLNDNALWIGFFQKQQLKPHPDFDALARLRAISRDSGDRCTSEFPVGSCVSSDSEADRTRAIIRNDLVVGANGLGKPIYCLDGDESRCGFSNNALTQQTQSQKKFFDLWYTDDLSYNKRIGQTLVLDLIDEEEGSYQFKLGTNSEEPGFKTQSNDHFGPLDRFKRKGIDQFIDVNDITSLEEAVDAPAWPALTKSDVKGNSYSFTTELHSIFTFNSSKSMKFDFKGDDDFWVFVNNRMVIDLGGLHSAQTASIDLNGTLSNGSWIPDILGLKSGTVYALDIFHAERQSVESNFQMTTSLSPSCSVSFIGNKSFDFEAEEISGNSPRFDSAGVRFNPISNGFLLQQKETPFSSTFLFTSQKENLATGFNAKFMVRIDGETQGFTFAVHNDDRDFGGTSGDTLNLFDVANSFAVAFDLCANRNDASSSCQLQTVSVHYPDSDSKNFFEDSTKKSFDSIHRNLRRDEFFPVEIIFYGDNPNFLEVYVNHSLYLRENTFPLKEIIKGTGGFVGFTSSSYLSSADIEIQNFSLSVVNVEPGLTLLDDSDFSVLQQVVADGRSLSDGNSLKTFDLCENRFLSGSLSSLVDAKFVEIFNETAATYANNASSPAVVPAVVIDNDDGSYTFALKTRIAADFKVAIAFGEGCSVDVILDESVVPIGDDELFINASKFALSAQNEERCFFQVLNDGNAVVRSTPLPDVNGNQQDDQEFSRVLILGILVGGGAAICMLLIFSAVLMRYRRKWNAEKKFVEPGMDYRRDVNTNYNEADAYTATGKKLLQTQQEILELQSHFKGDPRTGEVITLRKENDNMKDYIRNMKEQDVPMKSTPKAPVEITRNKRGKREEFALSQTSL